MGGGAEEGYVDTEGNDGRIQWEKIMYQSRGRDETYWRYLANPMNQYSIIWRIDGRILREWMKGHRLRPLEWG